LQRFEQKPPSTVYFTDTDEDFWQAD